MILTSLLLSLAPATSPGPAGNLIAIRVRRAETVANGTLEYAVILVENGKIVSVGEDLPIERGIPILELPDGYVVLPGLVDAYSRVGMSSKGYSDSRPSMLASAELDPGEDSYEDVIESGITTLGQYPAGSGIPGQAVAITPYGDSADEMILKDNVYLKVILRSTSGSKKMLKDGFSKADKFLDKEQKNREKWEKAQEKKKKAKSKKKKDDKDKEDDDDKKKEDSKALAADDKKSDDEEESDEYQPVPRDDAAQPFLDLRDKSLRALVSITRAGDFEHFLEAMGEEEFEWDLRIPMTTFLDVFHVSDRIVEAGARMVVEPRITLHPGTMRQRNLIAEFQQAGAKIVLIPRGDNTSSFKTWLRDVGEVVAAGLDRQAALRAMTLEPAAMLGLDERLGSIEVGKDANLVIVNGDPFETATQIKAVMVAGDFVFDEVTK